MVKKKHKEVKEKKDYFSYFLIGGIALVFLVLVIVQNQQIIPENKEIKEGEIIMNFFYLETCPHCHRQMEFHKELEELYPQLNIQKYELTKKESTEKFNQIIESLKISEEDKKSLGAVPFTVIGEEYNLGFGTDDTTGKKLIAMIEKEIATQTTKQ